MPRVVQGNKSGGATLTAPGMGCLNKGSCKTNTKCHFHLLPFCVKVKSPSELFQLAKKGTRIGVNPTFKKWGIAINHCRFTLANMRQNHFSRIAHTSLYQLYWGILLLPTFISQNFKTTPPAGQRAASSSPRPIVFLFLFLFFYFLRHSGLGIEPEPLQ